VMADGTDEDGALGEWEAEERSPPGGANLTITFSFLSLYTFVRGIHTPRFAHSATLRVEDFLRCCQRRGHRPVSFALPGASDISLGDELFLTRFG